MERKIGEIFEYNGEWYQCVEGRCKDCYFSEKRFLCKQFITKNFCTSDIIFKKLEKVGEPYEKRISDGTFSKFQRYRVYNSVILPKEPYIYCNFIDSTVEIEIKQTKEDMEENKLNLKPFDIQKAREGKQVCTRDGRKARIICFDKKCLNEQILIVLVDCGKEESIYFYTTDGKCIDDFSSFDLMMFPEKKEGWVNVYRDCDGVNITKDDNIYSSKDAAISSAQIIDRDNYVATTIIKWEE